MLAIEVILALVVIFLGIKHKKYLASVLAAIQAPFTVWFELTTAGPASGATPQCPVWSTR